MKSLENNGKHGRGWRGDFDPVSTKRIGDFRGLATITTAGRLDSVVGGGYLGDTIREYEPTISETERRIIVEVINRLTRLSDGSVDSTKSTGPAKFSPEATEHINDGYQRSLEDFTPDSAVHFLTQRLDGLYVVQQDVDPDFKRLVGGQVLNVARNLRIG